MNQLNDIPLAELRVFVTVAECSGFAGAAERLAIDPSVTSRSIKRLEQRLNTHLFWRTTRKVTLTPEGDWLLRRAHELLGCQQVITEYFSPSDGSLQGELVIDAATPFALHGITPILGDFIRSHPGLRVTLENRESLTDLVEQRVDVALRIGHLADSSMRARLLGRVSRGLYASPDYLVRKGEPQTPVELGAHDCLGFSRYPHLNRWPVQKQGQVIQVEPVIQASSGEVLKHMSLAGYGIACLSRFTVRAELDRGELLPVLKPHWQESSIPVYAVFMSDPARSAKVMALVEFLAERMRL